MTLYNLFPAMDADYNFPPEVLTALSKSVQLRNMVVPMTQAERDALTGDDLWDGRLIFNFDTDAINRYVASDTTWGPSSEEDPPPVAPTANQYNSSVAVQSGFAADTYLLGSNVPIPTGKIQVASAYRCRFNVTKSAAGVALPVISIRVGTAGDITDTQRTIPQFAAQTAVADDGVIELLSVFRVAGTAARLKTIATLEHQLTSTGLSTDNTSVDNYTSSTFDVTGTGLYLGVSVNGGTAAAWDIDLVFAELLNLAP